MEIRFTIGAMEIRRLNVHVFDPVPVLQIPVDAEAEAFGGIDLGFPAQEAFGFVDVGPGFHHVGLMEGLLVDQGFFAELLFEGFDHGGNGDGIVAAAEVDDFVADGLHGGDGPAGNVIYIGEIPALAAVAVEGDGGAFVDPFDEAEGRHVGSSGRSEDGEIAYHRHVDPVKFVVGVGHNFRCLFGGGVGGNGGVDRQGFDEGHFLSGIEGGGGGEHEFFNPVLLHAFQQIEGAVGVGGHIHMGIFHAIAHPGPGGEIEYGGETLRAEDLLEGGQIFDIAFDKGKARPALELLEAVVLDPDVVVVVEVVHADDRDPGIEQEPGGFRSDKAGDAGDQNG